jgi:hypothetical protein
LEGARTRQEETIAKQILEIEVFKNTTKKYEANRGAALTRTRDRGESFRNCRKRTRG